MNIVSTAGAAQRLAKVEFHLKRTKTRAKFINGIRRQCNSLRYGKTLVQSLYMPTLYPSCNSELAVKHNRVIIQDEDGFTFHAGSVFFVERRAKRSIFAG
jgi:hypothetical protein